MRPWLDRILQDTGPLELYDAHTHVGQNDPDGYKQTPDAAARRARAGRRARRRLPDARAGRLPRGQRRRDRGRRRRARPARRVLPRQPARRRARRGASARSTRARAASSCTRAPSSSAWTSRPSPSSSRSRTSAALPVLIHAGRGIPALGRDHGPARRAQPGRAPDPRPRRDLRPRLAVARAARPPQRPDRHGVVEPGRPRGAVRARAAGERRVGERLALRPIPMFSAVMALRCALQAGVGPARCAASPARRSRACSTGTRPADLGPPPGPPTARSTCCSSAPSAT